MGESVLFMRAHCRKVEQLLADDFRAIVFLDRGVGEERRKVVQEKILALPATAGARYVSSRDSLAVIEQEAPDLAGTVALFSGSPLPGAFEVKFEDGRLDGLDAWLSEVRAIPEVRDIRYKHLQAAAVMQIRFYAGFLTLIVCLAVLVWAGAAISLIVAAGWREFGLLKVFDAPQEIRRRVAAAGAGTLAGMAGALALALPGMAGEALRAWPSWGLQLLLAAAGTGVGLFFRGPGSGGRTRGRESAARGVSRLVAAVLAFALVAPASTAGAATVRAKTKELQQVQKELRRRKQALNETRKEEAALRRDFKEKQRQREHTQHLLRRLENRNAKKEQDWKALGVRLDALDTARAEGLEVQAEEVGDYRQRRAEQTDYYGSRGLWEDSLRRAAIREKTIYLARLGAFSQQVSSRHLAVQNESRVLRAQKMRTLADLEGKAQRLQQAQRAYSQVKEKAELERRRLQELEENAKALAALIQKLRKRATAARQPASSTPAFARHSLPWPASGKVLSTYGKKRVPKLNTWVIQNGIEIGASSGSPVLPVAGGEVIYAGEFRSYGRVVIVDHGGGFVSIYGQLGKIHQKNGERVAPGRALATVGSRKDGDGGLLYLELRQGPGSLDPSAWLKKR
ncbi:MAG: permease-like cell division protein FtsX [Elusimicrobiota bacterium]